MSNEIATMNEAVPMPKYNNFVAGFQNALEIVDDVVLKNYISFLPKLEIVPLDEKTLKNNIGERVMLFKITEMVYEKNEFASYKFASVFNTLASINTSFFVLLDSDGFKTDFYMGVRSLDDERTTSSLNKTLRNALIGQFPGIKFKTKDDDDEQGMESVSYTVEDIQTLIDSFKCNSISAVSCVANSKAEHLNTNQQFVQGLEKLVLSMQGQKYTGIIIANTTTQDQLRSLRKEYEKVYTQLSPFASMQVAYGKNENYGKTDTKGTSESTTTSHSQSDSVSVSTTQTTSESQTSSISHTHGTSKENTPSKVISCVKGATAVLGVALAPFTGGASLLAGGLVYGGLSLLGTAVSGTVSESTTTSESTTISHSTSETNGTTHTDTNGISNMVGSNTSVALSTATGLTNGITIQAHDKTIEDMLARIEKQLKRMDEFESLGMYECAAYFLSDDQYCAEAAANTYKAIIGGENTGVEVAAVTTWGQNESNKRDLIEQYVKNFIHPVFRYTNSVNSFEVTACSMVSGNELAIHMGLPRKSVCGFPVIEHADFGKEVVTYDGRVSKGINLGKVFNMGSECPNSVHLDKNSLSMHAFVTGSTGSGKSNTIYELIRQISYGCNFMVIEPAKGEYKNVFGNRKDVAVFGSNPNYTKLLKVNPFKFPKGIHILEHVDRLIEIFNVCWPMYAAMPAVLKEALLQAYEVCGWDLSESKNVYGDNLYPTFMDLQDELIHVISKSAYSEEVKSNYMGSLVTRVRSLTNGLNGRIFASKEIDNETLFDKNAIIDLSRIGSMETKSLIMGVLIMRLSEHRMANATGMNEKLKHITVLEEAHNILKRTSTEQNPENPSVAGKSVEMISNAIAEMRTYGEGFIIVDQSPSAVDISAIRNTNTKIIMRLPDESDRRLAGKAAGLKDEQLDEIAKLPKGVAVVYQNDWVEPVLCKIEKFEGENELYSYMPRGSGNALTETLNRDLLELLLCKRVKNPIEADIEEIKMLLDRVAISTKNKIAIKNILNDYEQKGEISSWKEERFIELARIVNSVLDGDNWIKPIVQSSSEFNILTDNIIQQIQEKTDGLNREYSLAAAQCLLRNKAAESDDYKEIYSAWITEIRNKGVI